MLCMAVLENRRPMNKASFCAFCCSNQCSGCGLGPTPTGDERGPTIVSLRDQENCSLNLRAGCCGYIYRVRFSLLKCILSACVSAFAVLLSADRITVPDDHTDFHQNSTDCNILSNTSITQ